MRVKCDGPCGPESRPCWELAAWTLGPRALVGGGTALPGQRRRTSFPGKSGSQSAPGQVPSPSPAPTRECRLVPRAQEVTGLGDPLLSVPEQQAAVHLWGTPLAPHGCSLQTHLEKRRQVPSHQGPAVWGFLARPVGAPGTPGGGSPRATAPPGLCEAGSRPVVRSRMSGPHCSRWGLSRRLGGFAGLQHGQFMWNNISASPPHTILSRGSPGGSAGGHPEGHSPWACSDGRVRLTWLVAA